MKVNTNQFRATQAMRRNGIPKNRPEQMLAKALIKSHIPDEVESEYTPKNLIALEDLDLTGDRSPRLDIAIPSRFIAIRLQGPAHDRKSQAHYDNLQRIFLEFQRPQWKVVDFVYTEMSVLWTANQRGLSAQEITSAYEEIRQKLRKTLDLPKFPNPLVIRKLANSQLFRSSKL